MITAEIKYYIYIYIYITLEHLNFIWKHQAILYDVHLVIIELLGFCDLWLVMCWTSAGGITAFWCQGNRPSQLFAWARGQREKHWYCAVWWIEMSDKHIILWAIHCFQTWKHSWVFLCNYSFKMAFGDTQEVLCILQYSLFHTEESVKINWKYLAYWS